MRQRLIVIRDGLDLDLRSEALGELACGKLPEPAEQAIRAATCEHEVAVALDPHELACEHRQRALLARADRKLVDAAATRGHTVRDQRAHEATW